jgi:hypothetical protein
MRTRGRLVDVRAVFAPALALLVSLFGAGSSSAATPSTTLVDGLVLESGVPVATFVDVTITVRDGRGDALFVDDFASVAVGDDGRFRVALDLAPVLPRVEDDAVDVVVSVVETGSDRPPLVAHAAVGAAFSAASASSATSAATVTLAATLLDAEGAPLSSSSLVSAAALALPGGPTVAWQNLTGRPAGVDDGDDGNVTGVVPGLQLAGSTLTLGTVDGAMIADATIRSAAIAASTLTTTQIAGLTSAEFTPSSLTAIDFASRSFGSADVAGTRSSVSRQAAGCALPGALTMSTSCPSVACATAGQVKRCSDGACITGSSVACSTTSVGKLIFAP